MARDMDDLKHLLELEYDYSQKPLTSLTSIERD